MTFKKLALAAVAGSALLGASGAFANPYDYDRPPHSARYYPERDYRWHERHHHYYHPRYVAQPVVVQPVYYPQPAPVYSSPQREIYGTIPIGKTDVRIGVLF